MAAGGGEKKTNPKITITNKTKQNGDGRGKEVYIIINPFPDSQHKCFVMGGDSIRRQIVAHNDEMRNISHLSQNGGRREGAVIPV